MSTGMTTFSVYNCGCRYPFRLKPTYTEADKYWPCSDACGFFDSPNKPCWFVVEFGCKWYSNRNPDGPQPCTGTENSDYDRELITYPFLIFRKKCLDGNIWVSEWTGNENLGNKLDNATFGYTTRLEVQNLIDETSYGSSCFAGECFALAEANLDCPAAGPQIRHKWQLEITDEGGGILTLEAMNGGTATYTYTGGQVCDGLSGVPAERDAIGCLTFGLTEHSSGVRGLPKFISVSPIDIPILAQQQCDSIEDKCRCCDPPDYAVGRFTLNITGSSEECTGFDGEHQPSFTRYTDLAQTATCGGVAASTELPCGVTYPEDAPCGAFWMTIDGPVCDPPSTEWGDNLGLLVYCTGDSYTVEVYCYSLDYECWVSQGEATVDDFECSCYGPVLTLTLPELDCCCAQFVEACSCATVPVTITADDGTNQIDMTYDAVNDYWQGSGVFFGCGNVGFTLQCLPGNIWYFIDQGALTPGYSPSGSCDPFAISFTGNGCDGVSRTVTFT